MDTFSSIKFNEVTAAMLYTSVPRFYLFCTGDQDNLHYTISMRLFILPMMFELYCGGLVRILF